ncbi:hypothetical protein ACFQHO_11525 [Actinomadura yumaensis]|uniref:hypothetical protein n=1 Tax=Actinomadura yumaensis TaxID=111807 RepID=UPI00361EB071
MSELMPRPAHDPAPRQDQTPMHLKPAVREWTEALRDLFAATGYSQNQFSRVFHVDKEAFPGT